MAPTISQTPPSTSKIVLVSTTSQTAPTTSQTESAPTTSHTPTTTGTANLAPQIQYHPSIYRVPEFSRKHSPHHFTPASVSFGPFHYGTSDHLLAMESQKRRVLEQILPECAPAGRQINERDLVNAIQPYLLELMKCYTGFEGMRNGKEEYIRILQKRHCIDRFVCRVLEDSFPEPKETDQKCSLEPKETDQKCSLEKAMCQVVKEVIEEFAHLLVQRIDGDEFVDFMVRGKDVPRLMAKYRVEILASNIARRCRSGSESDVKFNKEFAHRVACEGVTKFIDHLVSDGLDAFARLMVMDGVFQISLLLATARKVATQSNSGSTPIFKLAPGWQIPDGDTLFGRKAMKIVWKHIRTDMTLIENQIPIQVLMILLGVLSPSTQPGHLRWHVQQFLAYPAKLGTAKIVVLPRVEQLRPHVLACLKWGRTNGQLQANISGNAKTQYFKGVSVRTESKRRYDGIRYQNGVSFFGYPVRRDTIYIPKINLHDFEATLILNLLAFEHLHEDTDFTVTKYVSFMARLVRKPLHVKILQARYNIRLSNVWTKEEVSRFFQLAGRYNTVAAMKSPQRKGLMRHFTKNPLFWLATCYRYLVLLLVEDRGRWFTYIGLTVAVLTWLATTLLTILLKRKTFCNVSITGFNNTAVP